MLRWVEPERSRLKLARSLFMFLQHFPWGVTPLGLSHWLSSSGCPWISLPQPTTQDQRVLVSCSPSARACKGNCGSGEKNGICSCPGPTGPSCHLLLGCLITKVNRGPSALPHHSSCLDRLFSRPESWLPQSTPPCLSTDCCVSEQPTTQPTRPPNPTEETSCLRCWRRHVAYGRAEPCYPFGLTAGSYNSKVKSGCFLTQLRARKGEELKSWGHPLARGTGV